MAITVRTRTLQEARSKLLRTKNAIVASLKLVKQGGQAFSTKAELENALKNVESNRALFKEFNGNITRRDKRITLNSRQASVVKRVLAGDPKLLPSYRNRVLTTVVTPENRIDLRKRVINILSTTRRGVVKAQPKSLVPLREAFRKTFPRQSSSRLGYIYQIKEKATGRSYIGQTIVNPKYRISQHYSDGDGRFVGKGRPQFRPNKFDSYFRQQGKSAFVVKVLATTKSRAKLDVLEATYIKRFNTTNPLKGFNSKKGNISSSILKPRKLIINKAATTSIKSLRRRG